MTKLFVLAGGSGSRLKSLVSDRPKALAEVAGAPLLQHQLLNWSRQGIRDIVLLAGVMGEQIEVFVAKEFKSKAQDLGMNITVINETSPLGTGGAVLNALCALNHRENFLLTNADTWLSSGLSQLASRECNSIGVVDMAFPDRYGTIELDDIGVSAFREKVSGLEAGLINAGLYFLEPRIFQVFPVGVAFSLENDVLPALVRARNLQAVMLDSDFFDIGVPDDYRKFADWFTVKSRK